MCELVERGEEKYIRQLSLVIKARRGEGKNTVAKWKSTHGIMLNKK